MKNNILVSIILPTYNSEKYIKSCLNSIKNQTYGNIEIIIVDQKSTDETFKIIKQFKAKFISIEKPKFYSPPSKSRNIGAKIAKGEILYHLDSDMQLSKDLISEAVQIFNKHPRIGALIVHEKDLTKGFVSKCKALERRCYWGNDNIESARIVRKKIFQKIYGYDESISSGEDFDIHSRYKKYCDIGFCKNVVSHDLRNLSFTKTLAKKFSYGKTANAYFKKTGQNGFSILREEFFCFLKNYRLLLKAPVETIGMVIMKFMEILVGGLGIIKADLWVFL